MKALAGINFTVRLATDGTADLLGRLERDASLLERHPPPCPYAAFHALRVVLEFGHMIPDADARFRDLRAALGFFSRRWAVADQLAMRVDAYVAEREGGGSDAGGGGTGSASGLAPGTVAHAFGELHEGFYWE